MGNEKAWMKVGEFAALCGIDEQTIRRELRHGKLKGFKVGHQWLIPLEQFENAPKVTAND